MTQNATSFVNTIVETDWNKELQEIQDGIREETQTLEQEVEKKLGITNAKGESTVSRAVPGQKTETAGGGTITDFGRRLVSSTAEIFQQVLALILAICSPMLNDPCHFIHAKSPVTIIIWVQVRQQVDSEFTSLEQEAAKKPRSTLPKRSGKGKFSRIDFQVCHLENIHTFAHISDETKIWCMNVDPAC